MGRAVAIADGDLTESELRGWYKKHLLKAYKGEEFDELVFQERTQKLFSRLAGENAPEKYILEKLKENEAFARAVDDSDEFVDFIANEIDLNDHHGLFRVIGEAIGLDEVEGVMRLVISRFVEFYEEDFLMVVEFLEEGGEVMGIKVDVLKVFNGDSIHISYKHNEKDINIVIDSGVGKAYEYEEETPPYDIIDGEFKKLIKKLKDKKQTITLLILTHVDDDHIGGIKKWMESSEFDVKMIDRVWFNSGKLIQEALNVENKVELDLKIFKSLNLKTSISDGVFFEDIIEKNGIWNRNLIQAGDIYDEKEIGAKFLILSPSKDNLEKLLEKWEEKEPESLKTSDEEEYSKTLIELLNKDKLKYDYAVHNGSSIAFILEIQNKRILFLADSWHQTIVSSLENLRIESLDIDLVKISHHGSKYNTSNKLLKKINCKKFIISTNYSAGRPNKITLARIINNNQNCEIYFNYKEELEKKIFKKDDCKDFKFTIHSTKDLIL